MTLNSDSLAPVLQHLQDTLDAHAPAVAASLRPGLDAVGLATQAARLDFALPPELTALYSWHDGQPYEADFCDYFKFFPLADAVSEYLQLRQVSRQLEAEHGFVSWPIGRLPIFGFEGEYFALGCLPAGEQAQAQGGPIWFVFIQDDPRYWFDSLADLLSFVSEAYVAGAYRQEANGLLSADERALHALRLTRVPPTADQEPLHGLL